MCITFQFMTHRFLGYEEMVNSSYFGSLMSKDNSSVEAVLGAEFHIG